MKFRKVWKKIAAVCLALSISAATAYAADSIQVLAGDISVDAQAVVVMDADSGRVLYAQNPDKQLAMASTTKIMTALLTLEQPDLYTYFTVDSNAIQVEGTTMGLQEGDMVTYRQLAVGMLLPSGNDAANAAAVQIAGSQQAFVEQMNQRAQQLGLRNTHYVTPSGLDAPGHYSSAYDLAQLTREALQNPEFRNICGEQSIRLEFGNPPYARTLYNTNKLLERYPYAIGVKTGYTDDAGLCLVSAAEKDGITLIVVTLNAHGDVQLHQQFYEHFFEKLTQADISPLFQPVQQVRVVGGTQAEVQAVPLQPLYASVYPDEAGELDLKLELPQFVYAPVQAGEILGSASVYSSDGALVWQSPMVAQQQVESNGSKDSGFWAWLKNLFT